MKLVSRQQWVIPLAVFLLALIVRLPALDEFITVDEPVWADRSWVFVNGLLFADYECPALPKDGRQFATQGWGCTFQTVHPGVTVMWGGSLGLLAHYWQAVRPAGTDLRTYLSTLTLNPLDPVLITPLRLPLAVIAAVFIPIFYLLVKRLLGQKVALVAALLLALHPFHVALSRVLHQDALTTTFMVLSLLAMIGYWLHGWKWYWLLFSAVCAGLACLSKPVGWFMVPYTGVVGGLSLYYRWQTKRRLSGLEVGRFLKEELLWGVMLALTFLVFLPAMWVIPLQVLQVIWEVSFSYAEAGHIDGHYFMGQISRDPGPLFYPVAWLLRASPLELVGLLVLPLVFWRFLRQPATFLRQPLASSRLTWIALALFVGLLLLLETVSNKKMDRYFLPAFPVIDIFAALGLLWLADRLGAISSRLANEDSLGRIGGLALRRSPARLGAQSPWLLLSMIVLLGQGWLALNNFPYYFTYYNPLLGGAPGAARWMTIFGWGEGMDKVAAYLNQQPQAESLHVVAGYEDTLKPFFVGQVGFSRDTSEIMTADYVVYYYNQVQRRLQNVDAWRYFQEHAVPAYRVTLQGLDYALVYHTPIQHPVSVQHNSLPSTATLGYNITPAGILTLFWQNQGLDQPIWAGLTPAAGGETAWLPCELASAFSAEVAIPGAVLESRCDLTQTGAAPDLYDLRFGVGRGSVASAIDFPAGRVALSINETGHFAPVDPVQAATLLAKRGLPPAARPLDVPLGSVARWVGYQLEPEVWPAGQSASLLLYWQPAQELDLAQFMDKFQLVLHLLPANTAKSLLTVAQPLIPPDFTTTSLKQGAVAFTRYTLSLPVSLPAGNYSLAACPLPATNSEAAAAPLDASVLAHCLSLPVTIQSSQPGEEVESK